MTTATICVVGLGYIGLPTAAMLANRGCRVIGLEVNPAVIDAINRGDTHIVEPDLDAAVRDAVAAERLTATATAPEADTYVIAVPTPFKDAHQPDLRFVEQAARTIAPRLRSGNLVVLESTS
ncbi:MAG: UDP-N-acetyl-D-mannosamine dehydrogenase, partial [Alphaproteobacteria bacterium]